MSSQKKKVVRVVYENLRFQNGSSSSNNNYGGRRYMPYVFTEQGIAMLSAVLKSDVAVEVSIKIMNSFVEMRNFLLSNIEMFARLDRVELSQFETDKKLKSKICFLMGKYMMHLALLWDLFRRLRKK